MRDGGPPAGTRPVNDPHPDPAPAGADGPRPASRVDSVWAPLLLPLAAVVALIALWEIAPRVGLIRPTLVPPASEVARELWRILGDPDFHGDVADSAERWSMGLALSILVGVPLGLVMGRNRVVFHLVDPLLTLSYPVPRAVFVLVFVFWWGAGNLTRVITIMLGAFIPVVISAYHGSAGVQPNLIWSARSLGTGRLGVLARVVLPAALPQILSGIRLAITISLFVLIGSELLVRQDGVGAFLFNNYDAGQNTRVWASMVFIALSGFVVDAVYVRGVKRFGRWLEGEV